MSKGTRAPKRTLMLSCALALGIVHSGCAFKKTDGAGASSNQGTASTVQEVKEQAPVSVVTFHVPRTRAPNDPVPAPQAPIEYETSASRKLSFDTQAKAFKTDSALVIPDSVPDELFLSIDLLNAGIATSGTPPVIRGVVKNQAGASRDLPPAAFTLTKGTAGSGSAHIEFWLKELKRLFPEKEQGSVTLEISATDEKTKAQTVTSFELATPPSHVKAKSYVSFTTFEKERQLTIPDAYRHVDISAKETLELVGIIEIQNDEDSSVITELPLKLPHSLSLTSTQIQANVSECSYGVARTAVKKDIDADLVALPLTSNLDQLYRDAQGTNVVRATVSPKGAIEFGLYSLKPDLYVPPDNAIVGQSVPYRCQASCNRGAEGDWNDEGKWGGDCTACARDHDRGESCYRCHHSHSEWCRWQDWSDWKDYTSVGVGMEYLLSLDVPDTKDRTSTPMQLSFIDQGVPGRVQPLFREQIKVQK